MIRYDAVISHTVTRLIPHNHLLHLLRSLSRSQGTGLLGKGFVLLVALTAADILASTPSVSAQNSQNASELIIAILEGNVQKVKDLLKRGFDMNAR